MVRPTDREERKSETINLRVTPKLKEKLETEARMAGRKLSAECEQRLVDSMASSDRASTPETRELLAEIETAIVEIERGSGSCWHDDVATWVGVLQVLTSGPFLVRTPAPAKKYEDQISSLLSGMSEIRREREIILARLDLIGIQLPSPVFGDTTFGNISAELRAELDEIDLNQTMKERVLADIQRLDELDEKSRAVANATNMALEPCFEAAKMGTSYYERKYPSRVMATILGRLEMEKSMNSLATLAGGSNLAMPIDMALLSSAMRLRGEYLSASDQRDDDTTLA